MLTQLKIKPIIMFFIILSSCIFLSGCLSKSEDFNEGYDEGYYHPNETKLNQSIERLNKKIDIFNLKHNVSLSHIYIYQEDISLWDYNDSYQATFYGLSHKYWKDISLREFEDRTRFSIDPDYYEQFFDSQDHHIIGYIVGYQDQQNDISMNDKILEIENKIKSIENKINLIDNNINASFSNASNIY